MMVYRTPSFYYQVVRFAMLAGATFFIGLKSPQAQSPRPENLSSNNTAQSTLLASYEVTKNTLPINQLLEEARKAVKLRDFINAESLYQAVLIRERKNIEAILELAAVYESTGKYEYARGLLLRASVLRPHDETIIQRNVEIASRLSVVLHSEIDSLISHHRCELVIPKISMLLTIEPENSHLHYKKALCHLNLGRPEIALQAIDDALKLEKNEVYYKLRSEALEEIKKQKIKDLITRAIPLMGTDIPQEKEKALKHIGEILQIDPEQKWAKQAFIRLTSGEDAVKAPEDTTQIENVKEGEFLNLPAQTDRIIQEAVGYLTHHKIRILGIVIVLVVLITTVTFMKQNFFTLRPPLAGRLSQFSLKEILFLLNANARTGVMRIRSKSIKGEIYLENGEACHCKAGKEEGTNAFFILLDKARKGYFSFVESTSSFKKTIDTPLSILITGDRIDNEKGPAPATSRKLRSRMKELLDCKK